jgi:hypothetical protein
MPNRSVVQSTLKSFLYHQDSQLDISQHQLGISRNKSVGQLCIMCVHFLWFILQQSAIYNLKW